MPYPDELRTEESVNKERRAMPGPDGDGRALDEADELPRCPRCGSTLSMYRGDREICVECLR